MSHLLCTDNHKHIYIHSVTQRFLLTVKQTEKHLCALTVNRLYVNRKYSCNSIGYIKLNTEDGAGWEVRCLTKASSSLKTPAIPPFYKIITDNQSTKLVYNLVYRKDRGSRLERRGYWSRFSLRVGYRSGGGAHTRGRLLRLRPWFWDWRSRREVISLQLK